MTDKQKRFVEEYLLDLNATQAAIRAGYSEKSARFTGHENLTKPNIQAAIQKRQQRFSNRLEVTTERVLNELARIGFSDMRDLFRWDEERACYVPSHELTEDQAAVVKGVKSKTTRYTDEDGNTREEIHLELQTYDKLGALERLGKHLGLFNDQVEHIGEIQIKVIKGSASMDDL